MQRCASYTLISFTSPVKKSALFCSLFWTTDLTFAWLILSLLTSKIWRTANQNMWVYAKHELIVLERVFYFQDPRLAIFTNRLVFVTKDSSCDFVLDMDSWLPPDNMCCHSLTSYCDVFSRYALFLLLLSDLNRLFTLLFFVQHDVTLYDLWIRRWIAIYSLFCWLFHLIQMSQLAGSPHAESFSYTRNRDPESTANHHSLNGNRQQQVVWIFFFNRKTTTQIPPSSHWLTLMIDSIRCWFHTSHLSTPLSSPLKSTQ